MARALGLSDYDVTRMSDGDLGAFVVERVVGPAVGLLALTQGFRWIMPRIFTLLSLPMRFYGPTAVGLWAATAYKLGLFDSLLSTLKLSAPTCPPMYIDRHTGGLRASVCYQPAARLESRYPAAML